jgi:hypothetical protein
VRILLIDDHHYGLAQVQAAVPAELRERVTLEHLTSFAAYRAVGAPEVDVVLLDFYLDLDRTTGNRVAHEIRARHLVAFSSVPRCSRRIVEELEPLARSRGWPVLHAVHKLSREPNEELRVLFETILPPLCAGG